MSRPWMPLYIADYLADTGHLTTVQHGAYLLLIMHYWKRGGLPEADDQLAAITRMTPADWKKAKPVIQGFFSEGWKHPRIDKEVAEAEAKQKASSEKARGAANARWANDDAPSNAPSMSQAMPRDAPSQSHSPSQKPEGLKTGFGEGKRDVRAPSPPKHGAKGKGRVYIEKNTVDWQAYADDYRSVRGEEPRANEHGGRWFKMLGEASGEPEKTWAQRQIEAAESGQATPAINLRPM